MARSKNKTVKKRASSKKGKVRNFKKFIQGRSETLFKKADELYQGYRYQGVDAQVCVFVKAQQQNLLYLSDKSRSWPFDINDMKADHIMQSVDIAPNHLHNIIKETPRPPVPSVRRGKQNTPSDAEDSDAAFDPTCIDYGLETSRSPRPHRPDLKIHSTAIQPSKRKLTHHQAGKDVRDEEYEDDEEEVAEGEDEDDEDEDEEDEDEDDEDDEEEEAEEDVGLVFGESEDDGSIRPGKDSKRSKKQGRRAAYDAPVAAMVNYTTPQHQKTNYLKRSASTGGTEGRSLAKNRRKTTMDVSPRGRHKAPNPRRRKQTPPLKSPDYDWNYRT